MEETKIEEKIENNQENKAPVVTDGGGKQIAGAILIVGVMIAGAILLKGGTPVARVANPDKPELADVKIKPVTLGEDRVLGSKSAEVTLVMYEDFQCPWCGKFDNESEQTIRNTYVKDGKVQLVYRDFPFLGPESYRSSEAAMCANDQGKFWELHDYLFTHQNGENKGVFSDTNLKIFAKTLGLDTVAFNSCFDSGKYTQIVLDSKAEGATAGVRGTPKGFILKKGKVVDTIDGYMPVQGVTAKLDAALK